MDPVTLVVIPGLLGGLVVAFSMVAWQRRHQHDPRIGPLHDAPGPPPADVINSARIPVAGIGGLGMVAMALVVAITVPTIRTSMLTGLALGVLFAAALILLRRRTGSLPSSGRHPGAHAMLPLEPSSPDERPSGGDGTPVRLGLAAAPR